ncbi:hypothetical protein E2P47_03940 [Candidatus Bathyarchaeota archaeon]|nr:hypothetical protein E2P47_03940 [Candidatus Bathyarchaeota archaeon]
MYEIEVLPQKVVEPRVVVLKTRLDFNTIRLQIDELKRNFYSKIGFLKPNNKDIKIVNSEKYYEPYIIVGGKYSLDYCRKHNFDLEIKQPTQEIYIAGKKFKVLNSKTENSAKQIIKLVGEDYAHFSKKSFFILDRMRREISPKKFSFAPYDMQLSIDPKTNLSLRKIRITTDEVINLVRSRIAKRPPDLAEIIKEVFEVTENTIVYRPFFEFTLHNIKSNKFVTVRVDGISGDRVTYRFENEKTEIFLGNSNIENISNSEDIKKIVFFDAFDQKKINEKSRNIESNFMKSVEVSGDQKKRAYNSDEITALKFPAFITGEIFLVGDNLTAVVGDMEIPSGTTVTDTLVIKGMLKIGDKCHLLSKVKVLGDVWVGTNTFIEGDVVSGSNVIIGSNSGVGGYVKASGKVEIGENVVIGKKLKENLNLPRDSFDLQSIASLGTEEVLV